MGKLQSMSERDLYATSGDLGEQLTMVLEPELQSQLDSQRRKVDVDHFDVTIRELVRMTSEGELERAPLYQRKFRWDEHDESHLIESILLGLPIPSVFVATNANGTWEVVDGLQRLSTVIHFVADPPELLESIGKTAPLRLVGLEKVSKLNGLLFADFPTPLRLTFFRRALRVTALSDKSDYHVRFDMFERLNRGGISLTAQEVRGCIFRGSFNDLLRELADNEAFRRLVKLQKQKQDDGTREELVLKFFAYLENRHVFKGAVTEFLNDYMKAATTSFEYDAGRDLFQSVVREIGALLPEAFVRAGYPNTPLNQLEAVMVATAELLRAGTPVQKPQPGWMNDKELVRTSTGATNTASMLGSRIKRATELLQGVDVVVE
jgi:hypothetical protein